jgi:hypothetical protein
MKILLNRAAALIFFPFSFFGMLVVLAFYIFLASYQIAAEQFIYLWNRAGER